MYDTNDTIAAISSGYGGRRKIIRISGEKSLQYFKAVSGDEGFQNKIYPVHFSLDNVFLAGELYVFLSPRSYTGDDMVEVHIDAADVVVDTVLSDIVKSGIRLAEPGEFTARAFLNGKIGLAQAEAVAEIVSAGSLEKLQAAERLLAGRLSKTITKIRTQILDQMSLIEAGLDFSDQEIALAEPEEMLKNLMEIKQKLQDVLDTSIDCEEFVELPEVGIAGAPNAGKSSLINRMLGYERAIVSEEKATTRDVLTGKLELENNDCVICDCAGLIMTDMEIIDELAQQAAIQAIQRSKIVLFCIEAKKDSYDEDIHALELVRQNVTAPVVCVVTKCDKIDSEKVSQIFDEMDIGDRTVNTSSETGAGIDKLKTLIDELLGEISFAGGENSDASAINKRHRECVSAAIGNVTNAIEQIQNGKEELAAMFLRSSHEVLADIENQPVDEQMLERIFSTFCIGK